ncbi:MAG: P-loop NTPase fold protein [Lentimicrobium sp.]
MVEKPQTKTSKATENNLRKQEFQYIDFFSKSVNVLLKEIHGFSEGADLLLLMQILFSIHKDYGSGGFSSGNKTSEAGSGPFQNLILFLENKQPLIGLSKYHNEEWAEMVQSVIKVPEKNSVINGRMFLISALLLQFSEVLNSVSNKKEWRDSCLSLITKLEDELMNIEKIQFNTSLNDKGRKLFERLNLPAELLIDAANLSDGPTMKDSLSRRALAEYLAKRLRHIYDRDIDPKNYKEQRKNPKKGKEQKQSKYTDHKREGYFGSFFMHIDGAWGSGKSTLLGFLQDVLENPGAKGQEFTDGRSGQDKWIVVNFNAWENQRLDPPWWFLMKTVFRKTLKDLWKLNPIKAFNVMLREYVWRINTGTNYLIAAAFTLILFILANKYMAVSKDGWNNLPVVQFITFIGFLWSLSKFIRTGLVPGSAKAAQSFIEENGKDPMQKLSRHFTDQLEHIGYPVAIFIDDLDRCNKDYGIKLLEGLQTIFRKAPVVYVVAADRKWLAKMYEQQYNMFAEAISQPAKPFGMVFLDKTFQWILQLPDISSLQKKIYWHSLLNISDPEQASVTEADFSEIENQVNSAKNNIEKMNIVFESDENTMKQQIAREQIVSSLSIGEEEKTMENILSQFIDLIEPNPRAMIRLINDISTARAISFLYNQPVEQNQLILWTIFKQRYPLLADFFWNNPLKMDKVNLNQPPEQSITNIKEYDTLLSEEEVRKLFYYPVQGKIAKLDSDFLSKMKFQNTNETTIE